MSFPSILLFFQLKKIANASFFYGFYEKYFDKLILMNKFWYWSEKCYSNMNGSNIWKIEDLEFKIKFILFRNYILEAIF